MPVRLNFLGVEETRVSEFAHLLSILHLTSEELFLFQGTPNGGGGGWVDFDLGQSVETEKRYGSWRQVPRTVWGGGTTEGRCHANGPYGL